MKKTTLLLSLLIGITFTIFAQETVRVHMKVPVGSTVTVTWNWGDESINSDKYLDKPLYPNGNGDLILYFLKEYWQSYKFKVEKEGYRTVIGSFCIGRNSFFEVSLPPAQKDNSALDGAGLYERGLKFQISWDYKKANKLFLKSAKIGDVRAMHALGSNYHNGNGFAKNDSKAMYWYGSARQFGSIDAEMSMEHIRSLNGR